MGFWKCWFCQHEHAVAYIDVKGKIFCTLCAETIAEAYRKHTDTIIAKAKYYPARKDWTI